MSNPADQEHSSAFHGHRQAQEIPSKSWRLSRHGSTHYTYAITWAPGMLAMSGDIGNMVVAHEAFDDWENAARWVNNASCDDFMEKADVKRVCFNHVATVEAMIGRAYQSLRTGAVPSASSDWRALRKMFGIWGKSLLDLEDPRVRKETCRLARRHAAGYTAVDYYTTLRDSGDDAPCIEMEFSQQTLRQYTAFRFWAKEIVEAIEAGRQPTHKSPFDHIKAMIG